MRNANAALADRLAAMSQEELRAIAPDVATGMWGASGATTVDGTPVFVKRVPLTDIEAAAPYSTRNHFRLPAYYSYGVGSAGFGVWRELAMHELMSGRRGFPALLHHRVMSRPQSASTADELPSLDDYIAYWNSSAAIRRFAAARRAASHEVWIVVEHVPHEVFRWLGDEQDRVDEVLRQVFDAIGAMHALGAFHFDTHFGNVVTDGITCRVVDFGLAMADQFDLTAAERRFLGRHAHYDYGVALVSLGVMVAEAMGERLSAPRLAGWIDGLDELPVEYTPTFVAALRRHREPMLYMADLFDRLRRPSKRSTYDDATFATVLRGSGVRLG